MTKLLVISGVDRGKSFELTEHDLTSIGRDPRNGIYINDSEVSRVHATIKHTDNGFELVDRESSNGTFVNKYRVTRYTMASRDIIRVGKTEMIFDSSPVESMVNINSLVNIASKTSGDDDPSSSKIIETISAQVSLPKDDDSHTADSFLEQLEDNNSVIYKTAVATSRITDIDELHQKVLQLIFEFVQAERGCVLLMDPESKVVSPVAFRQSEQTGNTTRMDVNKSILKYVEKRNEGVLTQDLYNDDRWSPSNSSASSNHKMLEAMCVPMHGRMGTVGFIYVDRFIPSQPKRKKKQPFDSHFSKSQLRMLLAIAHQAGLATENANYYTSMTQNAQLAAVGEAFTQIAHHMRNMLQGMEDSKNRINQGLEKQDWTRVSEGWKDIDPLTTRIFNLSLNLLSFSRPRQPQLVLESLNDAIGDVVATVETMAIQEGIQVDWEPNLKFRPLYFDPEAIYRALLNVVNNAIDACDLGCVVKIRLAESDGRAEISVIDDGEGIDPRKINIIFKHFATTKGELGTGIGLPVTRKIMREHSGDVEVSSNLGHGSKFLLWMPVRRDRSEMPRMTEDTSMYDTRD